MLVFFTCLLVLNILFLYLIKKYDRQVYFLFLSLYIKRINELNHLFFTLFTKKHIYFLFIKIKLLTIIIFFLIFLILNFVFYWISNNYIIFLPINILIILKVHLLLEKLFVPLTYLLSNKLKFGMCYQLVFSFLILPPQYF